MLRSIDKGLAIVTWVVVVFLAVLLIIGPEFIAHDESASKGSAPYGTGGGGGGGGGGADGKSVFVENCGSCHTLSKAGTDGQVGPNLDDVGLGPDEIQSTVRDGRGGMPSFSGKLSDAQIKAVAEYVGGGK